MRHVVSSRIGMNNMFLHTCVLLRQLIVSIESLKT